MSFGRELIDEALERLRREALAELEAARARLKERYALYRGEISRSYDEAARGFAERLK